jgi:hypothetical protein
MRDIYIASDYIAYDIYRVKRRFVMAISFNSIKITEVFSDITRLNRVR